MALTDEYSAQEDCVVLIGATVLNNVYNFDINPTLDQPEIERVAFGSIKTILGEGVVTIEVQLDLYDEDTINASLKSFRLNHSSGIGQTIKIRPLGTGATLPELVLDPDTDHYGMNLVAHPLSGAAGRELPLVQGSMTWRGTFAVEPAWTAQSA